MSGICGIIGKGIEDKALIKKMTKILTHRGLDREGFYINGDACLGIRVSQISSYKSKLPFANKDDSIQIIYDGEIYSLKELTESLRKKGYKFNTNDDAEKILYCYEEYGLDFVNKLDGAFAIAIWDSRKKRLMLARDRIGEKNIYYALFNGLLLFGSEIKALFQYNLLRREMNLKSIHNLFSSFLYIPGPETIAKGIYKLLPGHILIWENGKIMIKQYWDVNFISSNKPEEFFKKEGLKLLKESVNKRLLSDKKIYATLSGGIDSSAIVALLRDATDKEIVTLTASFGEDIPLSESKYARLVANTFNTKHYDICIRSDAVKNLPEIIWYLDNIQCGNAAMLYYPLLKFIKANEKEKYNLLFNGIGGEQISGRTQKKLYQVEIFEKYFPKWIRRITPVLHFKKHLKLSKFSEFLHKPQNILERYRELTGIMPEEELKRVYTKKSSNQLKDWKTTKLFQEKYWGKIEHLDAYKKAYYLSLKTTIPDFNLTREDGLTSACSLLARSPLVDYKLMGFNANIPTKFNLKGLSEVLFFKKIMRDKLPEEILKRKKQPFTQPLDIWTREQSNVLEHFMTCLGDRSYFEKTKLLSLLSKPNKSFNEHRQIWTLLNIEIWNQIFIDNAMKDNFKLSNL
jgi:asparagine synthase (glutamine-hydrolysing)